MNIEPGILPIRSPEAEDAFVNSWRDAQDLHLLAEIISAALEEHRPQLAARLVSLLSDEDIEQLGDPAIERARTAARLVLLSPVVPSEAAVEDFVAEWMAARRLYMNRATRRMRRANYGVGFDLFCPTPAPRVPLRSARGR